MITDLFSHKIHSSGDEWPDKLAELASIFGEFDGEVYDRVAFEERLQAISPRASYIGREARTSNDRLDVSKFRDEISAYPSYLGLYFLEQSSQGWVVRVSNTAKRFLLCEEPDVESFLKLQLPLFQYPNAMGASYRSKTNNLRIQANARDRTLKFIRAGIHFSPVRLISIALIADATLRNVNLESAEVSYSEIFALANNPVVNLQALPNLEIIIDTLLQIREGQLPAPERYETRFHTLRHTRLFLTQRNTVKLRDAVGELDKEQLLHQVRAIASITSQFNDFDSCNSGQDLEGVIASGSWGRYFDGVNTLPSNIVELLSAAQVNITERPMGISGPEVLPVSAPLFYPFRDRSETSITARQGSQIRELADPELTKIKRQRRNLIHKELIDKMESWLNTLSIRGRETEHIDLYADVSEDQAFIFEMKSGGESLLDQIRKGISQLYEYRFRYQNIISKENISLCLVLNENPEAIPWITEYVCGDRGIVLCWFSEDGRLLAPRECLATLSVLQANYE